MGPDGAPASPPPSDAGERGAVRRGRGLRDVGVLVALVVAVVVGAVIGRVAASAVLPDLDELSALADSLVPADATAVVADDASRAGPQNLNLFMPPTPGVAYRSWEAAGGADGDMDRVADELRRRGWPEVEGREDEREYASGFGRASIGTEGEGSVVLVVTWERGWLLVLPAAGAMLGVLLVVLGVGGRLRGRNHE